MSTESLFTLPEALFASPLAAVLDAKQAGRGALLVHLAQEKYSDPALRHTHAVLSEQKRAEAERFAFWQIIIVIEVLCSTEPEKKEGSGCRMCDITLATADERTAHYKSARHMWGYLIIHCHSSLLSRFNLKLKVSGQAPVSEKEMAELQGAGGKPDLGDYSCLLVTQTCPLGTSMKIAVMRTAAARITKRRRLR